MEEDTKVAVLLRLDEKLDRLSEQVASLVQGVRAATDRLEVLERVVVLGNGQPPLGSRVTTLESDTGIGDRNKNIKLFGASVALAALGLLGLLLEESVAIERMAELLKALWGG